VSGVHQTENCSELLTAAQASGIHVDMMAEEFVAIDDGIATESMDDWEEELVRSYVEKMKDSDCEDEDEDNDNDDGTDDGDDDDVIILPEPVLTIREAYSIVLSLKGFVSKMEKKLVEEKLRGLRQQSIEDFVQPQVSCLTNPFFLHDYVTKIISVLFFIRRYIVQHLRTVYMFVHL